MTRSLGIARAGSGLLRQISLLLLAFLFLFSLHVWMELEHARERSEREEARRLSLHAEGIAREVGAPAQPSRAEAGRLLRIQDAAGAARISVMDADRRSLQDTAPGIPRGFQYHFPEMIPERLKEVWAGQVRVSSAFPDEDGQPMRAVFYPLRDSSARIWGVLRVAIPVEDSAGFGLGSVTGLLLKIFGVVAVGVVAYYGTRAAVLSQRSRFGEGLADEPSSEGKDSSKKDTAGFVMDTFQTLILQLKEKEHELERLRRVAEERADHIESYNENILNSVSSGVITFNQEGSVTTFNAAAERILGWPASSVIGLPCRRIFGEDSEVCRLVLGALVDKRITTRKELELARIQPQAAATGTFPGPADEASKSQPVDRIWVGVSTSLLTDKKSQVIGTTMVFTDISEIKRLQEQMELKMRMSMLGEMSAGIAHEFRNNMGTILGYAKLLDRKAKIDPKGKGMIQSIVQELEAMERLIHQLLDFSRTIEINPQPVDMSALIHRVVQQAVEQFRGGTPPKARLLIPPRIRRIQADEILIRQAMTNLVQNALEAMPEGGELKIQARARKEQAARSDAGPREILEIEIQDTGAGISREVIDRVFLPFFTTKEQGTGLGLALVHKIILSHNGQIRVDSQPGHGTTFRVYLPYEGEERS